MRGKCEKEVVIVAKILMRQNHSFQGSCNFCIGPNEAKSWFSFRDQCFKDAKNNALLVNKCNIVKWIVYAEKKAITPKAIYIKHQACQQECHKIKQWSSRKLTNWIQMSWSTPSSMTQVTIKKSIICSNNEKETGWQVSSWVCHVSQ